MNFKTIKFSAIIFSLFAIVNCSEEVQVGLKDFGADADPSAIDQSLNKAASGATIETAKPGQVVHFEENYTVDLNAVMIIADVIRTFKTRTDDATATRFFLDEDFYAYDENGRVKEEKHSEVVYEMKAAEIGTAVMQARSLALQAHNSVSDEVMVQGSTPNKNEVCGNITEDADGSKFDCVRYYNFSEVAGVDPVPLKAKARPNCANIPGCKIPVTKIKFDRVKLLAGRYVKKESFEISSAKTVPLLFPDLGMPINYFCIARNYHSEERSYLVNKCTVLRDLQL